MEKKELLIFPTIPIIISIIVFAFIAIIEINAIQPHQGKVTGIASFICCLGNQEFAVKLSDGTNVTYSVGSMSASDIITITNLKLVHTISMFATCDDVKELSR